jgi:AcrR family transcriptional regulator
MVREVKGQRPYDSTRRRQQAGQTRAAVIAAGQRLFLERGYAQTTMAAVAAEAGVSVETVYKAFGNKPGLVKTLFDVAIVGDDEPIPLMERDFVMRNIAEPDPRQKLIAYGAHLAETLPRAGPVQLVVRDAAATDAGAAEVWNQLDADRLAGMTAFAGHLHQGGYLREGVSEEEARDVLWTHNSVEVWDLLVNRRGWTNERFGHWVGRQLIAALL